MYIFIYLLLGLLVRSRKKEEERVLRLARTHCEEEEWERKATCGTILLSSTPSTTPYPSTRSHLSLSLSNIFVFRFFVRCSSILAFA
jgi:hypothetical protein